MKGISKWPRLSLSIQIPLRLSATYGQPVVLVVFTLLLLLQGISTRSLWASHEARAAQNAQTMLDDGDWLLPRLFDGQAELQKPPAFYWLVAAIGAVRGGVDTWAVRLPAIAAGVLTVLMVWGHLRQRGRPLAAFLAAAMLAGAVHFTGTARIGRIDVPLACVVTAMVLLGRELHNRLGSVALLGLLGGFALLLKGPIGIVLPVAVLCVYWCATSRQTSVSGLIGSLATSAATIWPAIAAIMVAVLIALPWYLWTNAATDGDFFRVFFGHHHFHRAFGGSEALAGHPFWYYIPRFAADFLPWSPLLLIALIARRWRGDADARFGLVWLVTMVAVLSLSRFKRADYLLPAYPGAAIFLGCALERWYSQRSRRGRCTTTEASLLTSTTRPKRSEDEPEYLPSTSRPKRSEDEPEHRTTQARASDRGCQQLTGSSSLRFGLVVRRPRRQRVSWMVIAFCLVLMLLPIGWFVFDRTVTAKEQAAREQAPFAERIREFAPAPKPIVFFRVESHLLAYHLGRPVHTLVEWADLTAHVRDSGPHYVVTRTEFVDEVRQHLPNADVVARSEDYTNVRPHRSYILLKIPCPTPPRD
jgi:hypothetical protein